MDRKFNKHPKLKRLYGQNPRRWTGLFNFWVKLASNHNRTKPSNNSPKTSTVIRQLETWCYLI